MSDNLRKLYIEPTSKCNLACTMCFRNTWIGESFRDMETGTFDNIIGGLAEGVGHIFFGGMGEPLFHPRIAEMVGRASEKAEQVSLLTNATLLGAEMAKNLLDAGLGTLWVSVDSFESGGYEKIRQNSNFGLISRNIAGFNRLRAKRERPVKLGLAFVVMRSNVHQLGELTRFATENGVSEVNISNLIPTNASSLNESLYRRVVDMELGTPVMDESYPKIELPYMDTRIEEVGSAFTKLLRSNCNLSFAGADLVRKRKYCKFVEENNAFVRHDGEVSPCMALLHSATTFLDGSSRIVRHHSFGNVNSSPLSGIWGGAEYTDFRRRVRNFEFSPCMHCGGCENRDENVQDCIGNTKPTCGACLWSEGIISCP